MLAIMLANYGYFMVLKDLARTLCLEYAVCHCLCRVRWCIVGSYTTVAIVLIPLTTTKLVS